MTQGELAGDAALRGMESDAERGLYLDRPHRTREVNGLTFAEWHAREAAKVGGGTVEIGAYNANGVEAAHVRAAAASIGATLDWVYDGNGVPRRTLKPEQQTLLCRAWFASREGIEYAEPCNGKTKSNSWNELGVWYSNEKGSSGLVPWLDVEDDLCCKACAGDGKVDVALPSHSTDLAPDFKTVTCEECEGSGTMIEKLMKEETSGKSTGSV